MSETSPANSYSSHARSYKTIISRRLKIKRHLHRRRTTSSEVKKKEKKEGCVCVKKNEGRGHCALGRERYYLIVSVSECRNDRSWFCFVSESSPSTCILVTKELRTKNSSAYIMHLFAIPDSRSKSFKIEPEIKIRDSVQIEFGLVRSMASGCLLFSFLIIKRVCSQSNVTIILLK